MGIAIPRPAMRAREARITHQRLKRHSELMSQFITEGLSRDDASKKAFSLVIAETPYPKARG
jgi:hypothetical protein